MISYINKRVKNHSQQVAEQEILYSKLNSANNALFKAFQGYYSHSAKEFLAIIQTKTLNFKVLLL